MNTTSVTKTSEMILDQIDVVKLDINLWTSSKKLRSEDLVLADGSKLPPEDLASLGTKKTINPEKLKEFNRIKKEAERICLESGTRFIGGFANPRDEIPRITKELDELSQKFYEEKKLFLASYEADTQHWIKSHAEFGDAIRRALEPVASVANKLHFDYVIFRVTKSDSTAEAEQSIDRKASSMSDQLFHEIAQDANQLIERTFLGKDTVTARSLSAFRRMRDKLDNLGFLDHRCMPMVDKIDSVLDALPVAGPYNGSEFNSLFNLGLLLSDPNKIKRIGSNSLNPVSLDDDQLDSDSDLNATHFSTNQSVAAPAPVLDIQKALETPVLDQVEANSSLDDLPDFDAFLATYKPSSELPVSSSNTPSVAPQTQHVNAESEVHVFMASVKETVNSAAQAASIQPESVVSDLDNDSDFIESEKETTEDFWF